jgi:hypothetical protein
VKEVPRFIVPNMGKMVLANFIKLFVFVVALALLPIPSKAVEPSNAKGCLYKETQKHMTFVYNQCDVTVTIFYCDAEKPVWGQKCGDNKKRYYTHYKTIQPKQNKSFFERPNIKYSACYGRMLDSSPSGIQMTSDKAGNILCLNEADSELRQLDCGNAKSSYYIERVTPGTIDLQLPGKGKLTLKSGKKTINGQQVRFYNVRELFAYACSEKVHIQQSIISKLNQLIHERANASCKKVDGCKIIYKTVDTGVRG